MIRIECSDKEKEILAKIGNTLSKGNSGETTIRCDAISYRASEAGFGMLWNDTFPVVMVSSRNFTDIMKTQYSWYDNGISRYRDLVIEIDDSVDEPTLIADYYYGLEE